MASDKSLDQRNGDWLAELLRSYSSLCGTLLDEAESNEIQILYTQIDRDADNCPNFIEHKYRVNPGIYFYPASTVKLAGAILALEKLTLLSIPGLNRKTPFRIRQNHFSQNLLESNNSAPGGVLTIENCIRQMFVVSDNDAYNHLYDWLGQRDLNERLWDRGYGDIRLTHRLALEMSSEENRHTNPVEFYQGEKIIYRQSACYNQLDYRASEPIHRGIAEIIDGQRIDGPKDFSKSNMVSVQVLQDLLRAVVLPNSISSERRFVLSESDRKFLMQMMSMLPRECVYPKYDPSKYHDSYVKFFLYGDKKDPMPDTVRIFNKVGLAYGYMIDNAYILDRENHVEFFLTAVIATNKNGIFNDEKYAYDEVGFPFLAQVGRAIYEFECREG